MDFRAARHIGVGTRSMVAIERLSPIHVRPERMTDHPSSSTGGLWLRLAVYDQLPTCLQQFWLTSADARFEAGEPVWRISRTETC